MISNRFCQVKVDFGAQACARTVKPLTSCRLVDFRLYHATLLVSVNCSAYTRQA